LNCGRGHRCRLRLRGEASWPSLRQFWSLSTSLLLSASLFFWPILPLPTLLHRRVQLLFVMEPGGGLWPGVARVGFYRVF
jgi:hypothetical protein